MGCKKLQGLGAGVWEVARRQHGVVTRGQLLELRFSSQAIQHRIERGRLHPLWRGVYGLGRPELTQHGRWMAAVLSCGTEAALSHESAAALWEIRPVRRGEIHVSVPAHVARSRPGIRLHRRGGLATAGGAAAPARPGWSPPPPPPAPGPPPPPP